jgi:DNA repair exonuclease SbcCD ATPase subunit
MPHPKTQIAHRLLRVQAALARAQRQLTDLPRLQSALQTAVRIKAHATRLALESVGAARESIEQQRSLASQLLQLRSDFSGYTNAHAALARKATAEVQEERRRSELLEAEVSLLCAAKAGLDAEVARLQVMLPQLLFAEVSCSHGMITFAFLFLCSW